MYVYVIFVQVCMSECVWAHVCACTLVQRPKIDIRHLLWLLYTLYIEAASLPQPAFPLFCWSGLPAWSEGFLSPSPSSWDYRPSAMPT